MKNFLEKLKTLTPRPCETLEERILNDVKQPLLTPPKSYCTKMSRKLCTLGGTLCGLCVGILLGIFLSVPTPQEPQAVIEPPKVAPPPQTVSREKTLELEPLIEQLESRNRRWGQTSKQFAYSYIPKNKPVMIDYRKLDVLHF